VYAGISLNMPVDSIGVEKKGNKVLVLYKVGPGETLSSISRKYSTSVEAIKAENAINGSGLKLGDILKVPYTSKPSFAGKKVHTVEAAQTLYAIARMYNVTTEDIKKWNNLTVNEISLGQQLVVGEEKNTSPAQNTPSNEPATENIETSTSTQAAIPRTNAAGNKVHVVAASQSLFSIAKTYNIPVENLKQWNNLTDNNLKVGQELLLEDIGQSAQIALDEPGQTQQESSISQEAEAPKNEVQVAESAKPRQAETTVKTVA
jgi:LysM repeat protein